MTKLTNIDTHAKFETVAEMDAATNQHIYANMNDLNETDRKVLDTIRRYSSIYRAAKMKVATIAELVGKSEITVRRSTAKLERLGIIERIKTKRPINVGQGANIYVILPFNDRAGMNAPEEVTKPTESKSEPIKSESDPLSFITNNKPKHTVDTKRGLRGDKIPAFIYDTLSPFLNETDLHVAYGALLRGKAAIDRTITFESNEGLFTDAILSVINGYKRGVVRSIPAVLYTAAFDTTAQIYRKEYYQVPDWLSLATH